MNEVFPLIFGREGGASIDILSNFEAIKTNQLLKEILTIEDEINKNKNILIDELYIIIKNEREDNLKSMLINLKRDVFNDRNIEKYNYGLLNHPDIENKIKMYLVLKSKLEKLKVNFKTIFHSEFYLSIEKLKKVSEQFFIKNGILFSSNILFNEINKASFQYSFLTKNEKNVVLSFVKYLTRSVTKTTPFSSLNKIIFLEKIDNVFISKYKHFKFSNFQTSNLLFFYLKEILIKNITFKNCLNIKSNSFIECIQEDKLQFFNNYKNDESFKKIKRTDTLLSILRYLESPCNYRNFIIKIEESSDEEKKHVEQYIDILIEEGLVKLLYPASNTDIDWAHKLLNFINSNQLASDNQIKSVKYLLNYIIETISVLENTFDVDDRNKQITACHIEISSFFINNNQNFDFFSKVQPQDLFYEDTLAETDDKIMVSNIHELGTKIKKAFYSLNNIPIKKSYRKKLVEHMRGLGIVQVSLLEIYEKKYLQNLKDFSLNNTDLDNANSLLSKVLECAENADSMLQMDISTFFNQDNIIIEESESLGVFIQTNCNDLKKVVINSFSNGYGANISRFLNFLPKEYVEKHSKFNEQLFNDKIIAEIKDASIHNTNTFPKLAKYLINISDDIEEWNDYKLIPISSLYLSINDSDDLIITNLNGNEIRVVNYSMEGINRKSKLTQFFDIFNNIDFIGYTYFFQSLNEYFEKKTYSENVVIIPEIIFEKSLILQRKKWLIKTKYLIDYIGNHLNELDLFYIRINSFKYLYNLPDEVFVRITKRNSKNPKDDNYKPQYINFNSPVLMLLFMKIIGKSGNVIELSEVYPNINDKKELGNSFVKEYILNLYTG